MISWTQNTSRLWLPRASFSIIERLGRFILMSIWQTHCSGHHDLTGFLQRWMMEKTIDGAAGYNRWGERMQGAGRSRRIVKRRVPLDCLSFSTHSSLTPPPRGVWRGRQNLPESCRKNGWTSRSRVTWVTVWFSQTGCRATTGGLIHAELESTLCWP